ncbi:MAG: hypothetical protein ACNYWU_03990 [Desulfobacterales bacterium]
MQEQGGKTKSCEIEALRAGGGQAPGALYHILLRTGTTSISTVMRRLLTGYAVQAVPDFSGTTRFVIFFDGESWYDDFVVTPVKAGIQ